MAHFFTRYIFIGGFFVGVVFAIIIALFNNKSLPSSTPGTFVDHYNIWFSKNNFSRFNFSFDTLRYSNNKYLLESNLLFYKIKVLCVILVHKTNYTETAKATWAKHCNSVSTINLVKTKKPGNKLHHNAWLSICTRLQKLPTVFDWILIVNDDTFAVLENVRYFVASLDSKKVYYLGHAIAFWGVTYNTGDAGILLSNGTLASFKNSYVCNSDFTLLNFEDYYLGKALSSLNITLSDTRDRHGLSTFHGFNLQKLFFPGSTLLLNYYKFSVFPIKCCSSYSVTFKVSASDQMFTYEYLLYQLQVFTNGHYGNRAPAIPMPEEKVWRSFIEERGYPFKDISADEYYRLWEGIFREPGLLGNTLPSKIF